MRCYVCHAKNPSVEKLQAQQAKHSRTLIVDLINRISVDVDSERNIEDEGNGICTLCLSKFHSYDWSCLRAQEQEKELKALLRKTEFECLVPVDEKEPGELSSSSIEADVNWKKPVAPAPKVLKQIPPRKPGKPIIVRVVKRVPGLKTQPPPKPQPINNVRIMSKPIPITPPVSSQNNTAIRAPSNQNNTPPRAPTSQINTPTRSVSDDLMHDFSNKEVSHHSFMTKFLPDKRDTPQLNKMDRYLINTEFSHKDFDDADMSMESLGAQSLNITQDSENDVSLQSTANDTGFDSSMKSASTERPTKYKPYVDNRGSTPMLHVAIALTPNTRRKIGRLDEQAICNLCDTPFKNDKLLENHMRLHNKSAGCITCHICSFRMADVETCKNHVKKHFKAPPKQCVICGEGKSENFDLKNHVQNHHNEATMLCELCGKAFTFASALHKHQESHYDDRPEQCPLCPKAFKRKTTLRLHLQTHTILEPAFSCTFCDKQFKRKDHLRIHERRHTQDTKKNVCPFCPSRFESKHDLNLHLRRRHNAESPHGKLARKF